MSQSTVLDIVQDSLGYMWFATMDGLNKYDGYKFYSYKIDENNPKAISSQYIRKLFIDHKGTLLVGGNRGISRYKFTTDEFKNYNVLNSAVDSYVSGIMVDQENLIWISTYSGKLLCYNEKLDLFDEIKYKSTEDNPRAIEAIELKDSLIYIGTEYGLYQYSTQSNYLDKIQIEGKDPSIRAIKHDARYGYWIGTDDDGLYLLGNNDEVIKHFVNRLSHNNQIIDNFVRDIDIDEFGNIWIGTINGLSIFNPKNNVFRNYSENSNDNFALSHNSIRSVFSDADGGIWLGTYYGGLSYYHADNIVFNLINQNSGNFSLNDNVISVIKEDKKGNLWIGPVAFFKYLNNILVFHL